MTYFVLSSIPTFGRWSAWGPCSSDCDGCSAQSKARAKTRMGTAEILQQEVWATWTEKLCLLKLILHCREFMRICPCALFTRSSQQPSLYCTCSVGSPRYPKLTIDIWFVLRVLIQIRRPAFLVVGPRCSQSVWGRTIWQIWATNHFIQESWRHWQSLTGHSSTRSENETQSQLPNTFDTFYRRKFRN